MEQKSNMDKSPIIELSSLEYFESFDGLKARLIHTNAQTFSFWEIKKDSALPEHRHINEQVSIVTKGILALTIDGKTTNMKPGMVALIPPNADHSGIALTDVEVTDVFYPVREDFPRNK